MGTNNTLRGDDTLQDYSVEGFLALKKLTEDDIRELQNLLGCEETGIFNIETGKCVFSYLKDNKLSLRDLGSAAFEHMVNQGYDAIQNDMLSEITSKHLSASTSFNLNAPPYMANPESAPNLAALFNDASNDPKFNLNNSPPKNTSSFNFQLSA